jgi:hypothetical protein
MQLFTFIFLSTLLISSVTTEILEGIHAKIKYGQTLHESIQSGYATCHTWVADADPESKLPGEIQKFKDYINSDIPSPTIIPNPYTSIPYTEGPLSEPELSHIQETGYLGPKKLAFGDLDMIDGVAAECHDYNAKLASGQSEYGGTNHLQWFLPKTSELLRKNTPLFDQIAKQISGVSSSSNIGWTAHLIWVGPNKGKAMLHSDWTSVSLWANSPSFQITSYFHNIYISLTDADETTSPLHFYTGTHKDAIYADTGLRHGLKNYKISEKDKEIMYTTLNRSSKLQMRRSAEAHKGEKDDYGLGICGSYPWFEDKYDTKNLRGAYYDVPRGYFSQFNPMMLHSSEYKNTSGKPRMSLVLTFNTIPQIPPFNMAYFFLNNRLHLGSLASLFTDTLKHSTENALYTKTEFAALQAKWWGISEKRAEECLSHVMYYKDNNYMQLINVMGDSNIPLVNIEDVASILRCMQDPNYETVSRDKAREL